MPKRIAQTDPLYAAALTVVARREQRVHPKGWQDTYGRWRPTPGTERRPCCARHKPPSSAWPMALLNHCRTIGHVAALYGVDRAALGRAVRELRGSLREKP